MTKAADTQPALRILLLENDSADAELVFHALSRYDKEADVCVADSREKFIDAITRERYDLILADYRLPDWTGMEALSEVRRLGFDTPLIIVTGTLGDEAAVDCVKAGAADYLLKGHLTRLPLAVKRALDETQARQMVQAAEQKAREGEERFRQLADNIDEVFFVMDAQFRETLYINPAYERLWGRTCDSLYEDPSSFLDPIFPADRRTVAENVRSLQQGRQPGKIEFRVVHANGSIRWLMCHAIPIRDAAGEVYRISGVALDVTESRRVRAELEESLERFRKLSETSFDAIGITQGGIIIEANRGYVEMHGYDSVDEIIGRPVTDFVMAESEEEVTRRIRENIEGAYEIIGRKKDGGRLILEVTGTVYEFGGKPGRITALRDITEKRALENQFRQAQKMEAVGRLAGGVAHDFNNLLTVITGFTDMVLSDVPQGDPRRCDLLEVRKAADAAAALTRQLLAFSRQQVIEPRALALEDVVKQTEKLLGRLIGEDIELTTKFGPERCVVYIDPGQVEQILMNLAVNARDAMPTGGKLTIETGVMELDEDSASANGPVTSGRYAMLAVADTGIGMDEAIRSQIFEPFFTTKERGKGTGLGLATVYGIVKQSHGFICVSSEPGKGAIFKIYLPLHEAVKIEAPKEAHQPAPVGTETILLVEDSGGVRKIALRALEQQGYKVIDADSGAGALALIANRREPVHLLVTDVVMPDMSGRSLAEEFLALHPNAKVLYMSGYTDDAIIRHGVLSSKTPFLQKPFTPLGLASRVREILDGAR